MVQVEVQAPAQSHTRIESRDVKRHLPALYPAVNALDDVAWSSGLEPELVDLVYLRASQINGCAYCVQYHTQHARELGVAPEKLTLVVTWEEAGIFSAREEAALAQAEARRVLRELMSELNADQQEALLLKYWEQLSLAEIAVVMGRSPAAVNSLLQRARASLYRRGRPYFLGEDEGAQP